MRHIGIVDITTVGACICANEIVAEANRIGLGNNHPEFTLHAFPFEKYKLILQQKWEQVAEIIIASIEKLQKAGADFVIIPSNTPHFCFALIQQNSPLPVLNLIEITVAECVQRRFNKVAVLGTLLTMQGGLYNKLLLQNNMQPVIPTLEVCERIQRLIINEIMVAQINPVSVAQVASEIKNLNCDSIILGCTELPEVYNEKNLGRPTIDTTRLLAHKALDYALQG